MKKSELLFLDFDGVVCDSLPETLVSSWGAYHSHVLHDQPTAMPVDFLKHFSRLRPYIRSGEDYLLIQDLLYKHIPVNKQEDFDRFLGKTGKERMAFYKDIFYDVRQKLLIHDQDYWFSLNPLFSPIRESLRFNARNKRIFILSTKRKEFILKIMTANHIEMIEQNIIDSGDAKKTDIISQILDMTKNQKAHFIDDQLSHFSHITDQRITLYLAAWGYIKSEWLTDTGNISILSLEKAAPFIRDF